MNDDIADAIKSIYGAVLDTRYWDKALDRLVTAFGARGAVIVMQETGLPFEGFSAISAYYRNSGDILDRYNRDYVHHEAATWSTIARQEPGRLFLDTDGALNPAELDAQPHYVYALEHMAIRRKIGFRVTDNPAWSDAVALAYDARLDAPPPHAHTLARTLVPHLGQAVEMGRTFSLLRQRYRAVIGALDRLRVGIAVVLPSGKVIVSNAEATKIFEAGDAIRLRRDGAIAFTDAEKAAQLQDILRRGAMTATGRDDALAAPMHLKKADCTAPLLISATSMRDEGAEIEMDLAATILLIIDMASPPDLDLKGFARLYGLTSAEEEVFVLMMEGDSTTTIAEKRNTSPHTANNQARAVLGKTACSNRSQLMRLVVQTLPPIF